MKLSKTSTNYALNQREFGFLGLHFSFYYVNLRNDYVFCSSETLCGIHVFCYFNPQSKDFTFVIFHPHSDIKLCLNLTKLKLFSLLNDSGDILFTLLKNFKR